MRGIIPAYLKGLVSYLPSSDLLVKARGTQSEPHAGYYYGIWMKHLTILWESGCREIPDTTAELGPGNYLGVGLAALLSGCNTYVGLDVVSYFKEEPILHLFEEMLKLFEDRTPCQIGGWPNLEPYVDDRHFPSHILTDDLLSVTLASDRLDRIREEIKNPGTGREGISFGYLAPWQERYHSLKGSVDLVLSHAVLQYVSDLPPLFDQISSMLRAGGHMSHQVDLSAHNISSVWNYHRSISDFSWNIIKGKRPYYLNRFPLSQYVESLDREKWDVICLEQQMRDDGIPRSQLTARWKMLSDEDLNCAGLFLQVKKK